MLAPEADAGSAPPARASGDAGRQRYVVGVFTAQSRANGAIAGLASGACEVLVVSNVPLERAGNGDGRVVFHRIDTSGMLASRLAAMLTTSPPFAALGLSAGGDLDDLQPAPGTQRLFQNLVHHLAKGAAVVVVHAPGAEEQLGVSRALLEAKCDILLTHEVLEPATEACCESCTSPTCGRFDPPTRTNPKADGQG